MKNDKRYVNAVPSGAVDFFLRSLAYHWGLTAPDCHGRFVGHFVSFVKCRVAGAKTTSRDENLILARTRARGYELQTTELSHMKHLCGRTRFPSSFVLLDFKYRRHRK